MKKLTLLVTVIFTVFMFLGNASAAESPIPVPAGYTLLTPDNGLYSSKNIDFSTFKWAKGTAAYIHELITLEYDNNNFYLQLNVETDGKPPFDSDYTFTSKDNPIQFKTYTNQTTGGYFWLMEDKKVSNSDKDYNDLWASIEQKTTPTPVPAAVWLFGSGLVGLVGLRRKNKK